MLHPAFFRKTNLMIQFGAYIPLVIKAGSDSQYFTQVDHVNKFIGGRGEIMRRHVSPIHDYYYRLLVTEGDHIVKSDLQLLSDLRTEYKNNKAVKF
jgi:hypothetical protein